MPIFPDNLVKSAMIDEKDRAILRTLQGDGRLSNTEIAERVHLSESASLRRIRALEATGLIRGYTAIVDQKAAGYALSVFLTITLDSQSQASLSAFEAAASKVPEIMECYLMTGEADYLMRVVANDIDAFEALHAGALTRLPGVARITSSIALRTAVHRAALPL
jgi:Lrp/AsnC family leucine-responsive transcriptional regulator